MPEVNEIMMELRWEKGQGPNYYFPSAASRPHFHLQIRGDIYAQTDYLQPHHLDFLAFTNRGGGLPNLHFFEQRGGVAYRARNFDANHLVVREFIGGIGPEHIDALHRGVYPVMNAARSGPPDPAIFPDL